MNSQAKMLEMQMQIRENANELSDYLRDLDTWENEIKKQDDTFSKMKPKQDHRLVTPVRGGTVPKKKIKKEVIKEKPKRIKSYDFQSWDKLDVNKLIEDIDVKEAEEEARKQEELEKNFKQLALDEKNKGNEHFKSGQYEKAVECYSKGMQYDPTNPLLPANRAMAFLKLKKFVQSEADCTLALSQDSANVKAYLRRGTARVALGKVESARKDFNDALKLEPDNKQAKQELENITKKAVNKESKSDDFFKPPKVKKGIVFPINKPFHLQSKKPLLRIEVQEIGQVDAKTEAESESEIPYEVNEQPNSTNVKSVSQDNSMSVQKSCSSDETLSKSSKATQEYFKNTVTESLTLEADISKVPSVPNTCFQFQADVKKLQPNTKILYQYLLQLNVSCLSCLLKDQLDTDLLLMIIKCFNEHVSPDPNFVVDFLNNLTKVKRFDMAVMFLSKSDRQLLHSLHQKLLVGAVIDKDGLSRLFQKFKL